MLKLICFCRTPHPTIRTPPSLLGLICYCKEYVFQNWGVPCNNRVLEEEKKRQIFGSMCRGGRLRSFAGS